MDMIVIDNSYRFSYDDKNLGQIPAAGGTRTANLYMAIPLPWQLSSLPDWVACTPSKGTNSTEINFSIDENEWANDRIAVYDLTINLPNYTSKMERSVSQKGATPYLTMTPTETQLVEYDAHPFKLSIKSNASWQLECDQPDAVSFSKTSGTGSEDVTVTLVPFDVIDHTTTRTFTITLFLTNQGFPYSQSLTIVQRSQGYREKVKQESLSFPWKASDVSFANLGKTQSFKARTNDAWINISPSQGSGMLSPTIRVMANASFVNREGFAYVDDSNGNTLYEFHVAQAGVECELSQEILSFECNAQDAKALSIKTNAQWTVSTKADWINVDNTTINEGSSQLNLSVSDWLSTSDRMAFVTLSLIEDPALTRSFLIQQYGTTLVAEDELFEFLPEGGEKTYSFNGTSAWTSTCEQDWISVSPNNGKGAGTLTIRVDRNPLPTSRVGYIHLTDNKTTFTITIHQASTEITIKASDLTFESKGGQKLLQLSSNDVWTAELSNADWLSLSPISGYGNVALTIIAATNKTAQARSATLRLSANGQERTATIRQKESVIKTSVSKLSFFKKGGIQRLTFECDDMPTATTSVDWLTTNVSNNQLQIAVDENNTNALRTGLVTLSIYEGAVTATITIEQLDKAFNTNGYEPIDLGLPSGTLWAACNVGASSPEEYGDYFAWGDTLPREAFDWSTYKWCDGSYNTLIKYCIHARYGLNGYIDRKTILDIEDDAVRSNMGGDWRLPSQGDLNELRTECSWIWTTYNNVNGYKVVGPNGYSIFLPAAGFYYGSSLYNAGSSGCYWSSSLNSIYSHNAFNLSFSSSDYDWNDSYRFYGQSVRGVLVSRGD